MYPLFLLAVHSEFIYILLVISLSQQPTTLCYSSVVTAVAIASMSGSGNQVVLPDQYKFFFSLDSDYKDINLCFALFSEVLYCFRKVRV